MARSVAVCALTLSPGALYTGTSTRRQNASEGHARQSTFIDSQPTYSNCSGQLSMSDERPRVLHSEFKLKRERVCSNDNLIEYFTTVQYQLLNIDHHQELELDFEDVF